MPRTSGRIYDIVLVGAALLVAAVVLRRELMPATQVGSPGYENERIAGWERLIEGGVWIGPRDAPIQIIEFGDLECPACRAFHERSRELFNRPDGDVSLVFVHLPLPQHRFARLSARGLECASEAGSGSAFLDVIYSKQDSIGLKTWDSFAAEAGIRDITTFSACMATDRVDHRIDAGVELARNLDVNSTPTVVVNGWRFATPPSPGTLSDAIKAVRQGEAPFREYAARTLRD